MGKTRDLFKKIRDTKGKFHTKMGEKETDCQPLRHLCVWETLYRVHVGKEFYSGQLGMGLD